MAASDAWTTIEAAPPQPRLAAVAPDRGGAAGAVPSSSGSGTRPVVRLRRHRRMILGAMDDGGVAFQRCGRAAVLGAAAFVLPSMILDLVAANAAFDRFTDFDDASVSIPGLVAGIDAANGVEALLTTLALVIDSASVAVAGGVLALVAVRRALGQPVVLAACLRSALRATPALLVAWLLGHLWVPVTAFVVAEASVDQIAPFLLLAVPVAAWLTSLVLLVSPVLMIERLGPWASVRRAFRLARVRAGACFGFVLMSVLLGGGLRLLLGSLPRLMEATGLVSFGRFGGMVEGVAGQLATLVSVPFVGLATAMLYLQVRIDAEGMDLLLEADRAFP